MSEIKLRDVLHLYIGCEVEFVGKTERLDGRMADLFRNGYVTLKPVLRPLSDMTKAEQKHIAKLNNSEGAVNAISFPINRMLEFYFKRTNFMVVAYLLKQGFDLFGLIESSQAISSPALKGEKE